MTKAFDEAIEAVRRLPPASQDAIAGILQDITDDPPDEADIPAEHLPAVSEGLARLDRGDFVEGSPADLIRSAFRRS